jgi:hypothetical protein
VSHQRLLNCRTRTGTTPPLMMWNMLSNICCHTLIVRLEQQHIHTF